MAIATTNPATGEVLTTFEPLTDAEIDTRLEAAAQGFKTLRRTSFADRAGWMRAAADILDAEQDQVATLMTTEMGKTLASAKAEVAKCAKACRFYAEHAEAFLADAPAEAGKVNATQAYVRYQPLGPVLAIMPWNFPLWQAMRFAAPALMAGNVGLLKHASNVPQTALFMQDLFSRAGFPDGSFQTLLIGSSQVEAILADDRVAAATLTGSEGAGRSVAEAAGRNLKKTVLELGGSDPFVVMPSADIAKAAKVATTARCQNNGQSCIAAKRFIVHADVYDAFAAAFVENMTALVVGDPMEENTDIGPLATEQGRDDVAEQVRDAVDKGAKVLCGGERIDQAGWWYPPTVVAELTTDMQMYAEEVFGPVAGLYRVQSYDEAIELANSTKFGLGSNAWTTDPHEQQAFSRDLEAGAVFINGMTTSYPELPFGGIKASGYGRELSAEGIREFCNVKSVWIGDTEPTRAGAHAE
ncbi:NADP-dependent succinic semialdehyde dehydrogenase [Jatrophihabitans sp.]|uniref:NADP-dependent succinic semialdehyde dehydrogenase n=1 Tax=Jatrophihabitans sp. TaxID=1932789 RepID=UPI002BEC4147|nr:NADP-dependent succinic semialdehyde dehydrogenase [Jatrophihabitans sp.]